LEPLGRRARGLLRIGRRRTAGKQPDQGERHRSAKMSAPFNHGSVPMAAARCPFIGRRLVVDDR
jgi:hypothetical protein